MQSVIHIVKLFFLCAHISLILSFIMESFLIFVISIVLNEIIVLNDNLKIPWNETVVSLDV
jgi:hypothetical protein